MNAVKAYYDGKVFIPIEPVIAKMNQSAVITILDEVKRMDKPHLKFVNVLSHESFNEISMALLDSQKVDTDEW